MRFLCVAAICIPTAAWAQTHTPAGDLACIRDTVPIETAQAVARWSTGDSERPLGEALAREIVDAARTCGAAPSIEGLPEDDQLLFFKLALQIVATRGAGEGI